MYHFQVGELIRQERQRKGFSQHYVGSQLGISQQAYSLMEKEDSLDARIIYEIAVILDCSPYKFMPRPGLLVRLRRSRPTRVVLSDKKKPRTWWQWLLDNV